MGVKYIWWSYARRMIQAYPERKLQYEEMLQQHTAPRLDGTPNAKARGDPVGALLEKVEKTAIYKEYSAVNSALRVCSSRNPYLLEFVKLYYWRRPSLSLEDIALKLHYSPETIRKWNKRLIYAVAVNRGLLDENRPIDGQKGS